MEPFIGQIVIFPFNFPPQGWALCEGQLLTIQSNPALFSLIGPAFGGDGKTTFALPNYQGQAPKGSNYFIALRGVFPQH